MVTFTNKSLATPDVIRNLGMRFRDYRLRLRMTRKEISESSPASANDVIVTIRHNPLVQRALQHAFFMPLLMDSNGFHTSPV